MKGLSTGIGIALYLLAVAGNATEDAISDSVIPEPGVLGLLGIGAAVAVAIAWNRRRR